MKRFLLVFALSVMLLSCLFGKTLVVANGEERGPVYSRYYRSIEIEAGDSLWSIAKTYNRNSGMNIREYIDEIKKINHTSSDVIEAGDSLMIIYFSETPPDAS